MIIIHGIYEDGKITITDKNIPKVTGNVEIKIYQKSWMRKPRRVKLLKKVSASELIVKMREEN